MLVLGGGGSRRSNQYIGSRHVVTMLGNGWHRLLGRRKLKHAGWHSEIPDVVSRCRKLGTASQHSIRGKYVLLMVLVLEYGLLGVIWHVVAARKEHVRDISSEQSCGVWGRTARFRWANSHKDGDLAKYAGECGLMGHEAWDLTGTWPGGLWMPDKRREGFS